MVKINPVDFKDTPNLINYIRNLCLAVAMAKGR